MSSRKAVTKSGTGKWDAGTRGRGDAGTLGREDFGTRRRAGFEDVKNK